MSGKFQFGLPGLTNNREGSKQRKKERQRVMPACLVCGKQTDLLVSGRGQYVCIDHVMLVRNEFAYGLRYESFRPYDQELVDAASVGEKR
jgi:hypothetical protein